MGSRALAESNPQLGDGAIDQITSLLVDEPKDEETGEETLSKSSTDKGESESEESKTEEETDESEETGESEDTPEEETSEEADASWEDVLGISEDKLSFDDNGNVVGIKTKVNDEESVIPIKDVVAGYQQNKAITQKGQALGEEKRAFEAEKEEFNNNFGNKISEANTVLQFLENQVVSEFEGIDWDSLRDNDPGRFAAMRQDYAERANNINLYKQAMANEQQRLTQEHFAKQNDFIQQYEAKQRNLIVENNPTWVDQNTYEEQMSSLQDFAKTHYGFSDEDLSLVKRDARLVELMKDASSFRKGKQIVTEKKVANIKKFQKSSGKSPKSKASKLTQLTQKAAKATGAGRRNAQADAVAELLLNGDN